MVKRDKRRRYTILVMVGMVFLLHYLGILTPLILTVSALVAIWVVSGLAIDFRPVRMWLRMLLKSVERRWLSLWEQIEQGTGSWHI
jgi:uncharacterized membrane protein